MRLSRYFLPILRETPKEAEIVSHRLMLRAGMMRQEAAGIYAFLPLGLRVLDKICRIVREEQNRSGAIELLMPTIQSADLWRESGRYDAYGKEMLRIKDRHERDMLYGPTNEEMITEIFRAYVRSYKDLPLNLYHIQWKFRDEVRPRFGLMRGREFLMKDAYSFDVDQAGARHSYNKMFVAYLRTFARLGLKSIPMRADTGPIGGDLSHEFIILADTGESEVFCHRDYLDFAVPGEDVDFDDIAGVQGIVDKWTSLYAATSEMHERGQVRRAAAGQAGLRARHRGRPHLLFRHQIFRADEGAGRRSRRHREAGAHGLLRHRPVAPGRGDHRGVPRRGRHQVAGGGRAVRRDDPQSEAGRRRDRRRVRAALRARSPLRGVDVLYHDIDERPGAKFATADLIGIPWQILVGPKGLAAGQVELKRRADGSRERCSLRVKRWRGLPDKSVHASRPGAIFGGLKSARIG